MRRLFLVVLCVLCLVLCACTPVAQQDIPEPNTTPAPSVPKPTPDFTLVAPDDTPENTVVDHEIVVSPDSPSQGGSNQGGSTQGGSTQGGNTDSGDTGNNPFIEDEQIDSEFELPIFPE